MNDVLEILKSCDAFLEGHFLLSSGRHSSAYCQMAYLQQYPEKCAAAMKPVAEKLRELDVDVIVGPAMGGIVYAYELARQTGKRAIFTERVDNVMTLKRFSIRPGEKCIIAEDVVTTGVSSLETKRTRPRPFPSWPAPPSWTSPTMRRRNAPSAKRASCRWCIWAAVK